MKSSHAPLLRIAQAIGLLTLFVGGNSAHADVKMSALWSDGIVLQRGAPIPVWGTADVGEGVSVALGQSKQSVVADANGKWLLHLPAMAAASGLEMTVSGKNTLHISNVAVGEVWLASGQSNMELRVPRVLQADAEIAAANYPLIRQFRVGRNIAETPQTDLKGTWEAASPQTVSDFTAVGYFFARELFQKLGVPVGIIHSSYGGTPAEAWTSESTLKSNPALAVVYDNWTKTLAAYPQEKEKYDRQMVRWNERAATAKAAGKPAPVALIAPAGPGGKATPSGLYNGMIAPLVPYGIKGILWYQGESNSRDPQLYQKLFPALIQGWRHDWNAELPFLFVQLANFHKVQTLPSEGGWALIREAQASALSLPDTGMAVTIDLGQANEIHYPNKQEVGRRLALVALARQYGQTVEFSGPQYSGMSIEPGAIRLRFTHAQGLKASEGGELKGFAIAGKDGNFVWAQAKIEGEAVLLSSPQVPAPVAARYDWADNPVGNLVNAAALPAVPFRTDPENNATPMTLVNNTGPEEVPDTPVDPTTAATIATGQGAEAPAAVTEAVTTQPTRTVVYKTTTNAAGDKVDLVMNIFEPPGHKASDKTPAIVFFFGGGWNDGSPKSFFPHCAYFASRGLVAIAPDYRVKTRQQTTPFQSVADAKSAMRFVRQNAPAWGIDPNRMAAAGSSAGGHVAACTAIIPGLDEKSEDGAVSSAPNALVLYNPVIDTSPAGYGNERLGDRWQEISPLQHVRPGLPPTIVFHGTADKVVPYANAVAFETAMKAAGNRCELVTIRGEGHGFAYQIQKKSANRAVRETDVFLASLGYLQGEPTLPPPTK
ncbi:acetylxylan esterase [Abditibacteriota bacterium]|nr:acetylxylan esterase [Abditibacteriota bacterium]